MDLQLVVHGERILAGYKLSVLFLICFIDPGIKGGAMELEVSAKKHIGFANFCEEVLKQCEKEQDDGKFCENELY